MDQIIWTDEFSVGIDFMDEQHKQLVGIINRLIRAKSANVNSEEISDILTELTNYVRYHFTEEEAMLERYGFPDLEKHRKDHVALAEQLYSLVFKTMNSDECVPADLLRLLLEWLKGHILHDDMAYGKFLADKNISAV